MAGADCIMSDSCSSDQTSAQNPVLTLQHVLISVFVAAFVGVLLVTLSKRRVHWSLRKYYAMNRHHWCYTSLYNQSSYCSVCAAVIVASNGAYCDCCGICTDCDLCTQKADDKLPCKPLTTFSSGETLHHWVKGNLPVHGCLCVVCKEECGDGVGLIDFQCVWCNRTVHATCRTSLSATCDFGELRDFVVLPHCVQLSQARFRRGLTIKKIVPSSDLATWSPVFIIGNNASGSSEAASVLSAFRRVLNPVQVVDMTAMKVEEVAKWCKRFSDSIDKARQAAQHATELSKVIPVKSTGNVHDAIECSSHACKEASARKRKRSSSISTCVKKVPGRPAVKIVIAGGDGTIAWVLNTFYKKKLLHAVEISLVPLGTGNDLSRALGWGSELDTSFDAAKYLLRLRLARSVCLDRWLLHYWYTSSARHLNILPAVVPTREVLMNNYLSIGVDALVTLRFHQARQSPFYLFNSRFFNKLIYFGYGTVDVLEHACENLHEKLRVFMDGKAITVPALESLVVLNIPCWGAGVRPWSMGTGGKTAPAQAMDDGLLEVLGVVSSFHICQLQMGITEPVRLGQCSDLQITLLDTAPMQVDGEPWLQKPGTLRVCHSHTANVLSLTE